MNLTCHILAFLALYFVWSGDAVADTYHLLPVASENLNEEDVKLPTDLPSERTLLILAFQREQQDNIDTWINGMALRQSNLPWLELPVIDNPGLLGRWFINSGMRNGIPDTDMRSHVVSLYTDKAAFLSALGIVDEKYCYALVVDRSGRVLENVRGDYTAEGAKKILRKLNSEE